MNKLSRATLLIFCIGANVWSQQPFRPPAATASSPTPVLPAREQRPLTGEMASELEEGVIHLDVRVTDGSGKPVVGLGQSDFTLLDNGLPTKIQSFHAIDQDTAKSGAPTKLTLVLDALNLRSDGASAEKALDKFLRRDGGHLALTTSVYRLSLEGLSVTSQPSTDGNALANELVHKRDMRLVWLHQKYTCELPCPWLHDGGIDDNLSSQRALGTIALEARQTSARNLVIWIGVGWPVTGQSNVFYSVTEFSTRLREGRIALYRVNAWDDHRLAAWDDTKFKAPRSGYNYHGYLAGVKTGDAAGPSNLSLEVLATHNGGAVLGPTEYSDAPDLHVSPELVYRMVADPIARILAENSSCYRLSFDPPRTEQVDEYHDLQVVIGRPGLTAHTNSGYYDQPVYYNQPRVAARRLAVAQLEAMLEEGGRASDSLLADELSTVELTERMSSSRLMAWKSRLSGKKAWQALVSVADASAFLSLPASDISTAAPPSLAEQREQFSRVLHYLSELEPRLPNLFATRTTDRYQEPDWGEDDTWKTARANQALHLEASNSVTVLYRNGSDFVQADAKKSKKPKSNARQLETHGTFSTILATVVSDAVHGQITWDSWEKGEPASDSGPTAVFRYAVPKNESHYEVTYCCYPDYLGSSTFQRSPGYHGKIAFDPATGAILRVTVQPDLSERLPLIRSDIAVEYGPVETGGSTYIYPVRSVSITRGRPARPVREWGQIFETYGSFETLLADVTFRDYHRFGSTERLLPGFEEVPDTKK